MQYTATHSQQGLSSLELKLFRGIYSTRCAIFFSPRDASRWCALCLGRCALVNSAAYACADLSDSRKTEDVSYFYLQNHFNQRVTNRRQSYRPNCGLKSGTKRKLVNFFLRHNSGIVYCLVLTTGPSSQRKECFPFFIIIQAQHHVVRLTVSQSILAHATTN